MLPLVQVDIHAKAEIAPHNRLRSKHERHALDVAVSLLCFAFTNEVRIKADARIVDEHAAVDLDR